MPRPLALALLFCAGPAFAQGTGPLAPVWQEAGDGGSPDGGVIVVQAAHDGGILTAQWIEFDGLSVLPEEVYRAVLVLPPGAGPDPATAASIERQIRSFLLKAGYELADVDVHRQADGGLLCSLNEGQLEKVVFRGRLTVQTVRFKLALDIPHDVFNRPDLERQVRRLEQVLGLQDIRLELLPSSEVKHVGPQLESMPEVKGFELIHERRPYELHIVLPDRDWDTGLGADLRVGYVDGLELGLNYQGRGGIFKDDRWRVAAAGGAGLRNRIPDESLFPAFSRAAAEVRYFFPAIMGHLRPAIHLEGALLSRLRRDLNLADYFASELSAALWLEWEPEEGIRLQIGGGFFDRRLFGLLPGDEPGMVGMVRPGVEPEAGSRPFAALRLDFTFDPENERWDRRHMLRAQIQQHLPGINAGPLAWARYQYQWLKPFGWHDLWLRSKGYVAWYQTTFHDEASLGEFLHGCFGRDFVRRAASVGAEFRFSVTRDVLKLAWISTVAVYTQIDRERDTGPFRIATAFGPGFSLLLEGMFQLDMYLAFGVRPFVAPSDRFTVAASALLLKAF